MTATRTERTDIHRPSAIIPDNYEYVAQEHVKIESIGDCEYARYQREIIQRHMQRTGGTYSRHEHGGNCMVCGSVNAVYTILFWHRPTNTYVRMGEDCAQKCDMGGDLDTSAFRAAVRGAMEAQAGKRKAQAMLAELGLERCWETYTNDYPGCTCSDVCRCYSDWKREHYEESIIADIVGKLVKYGDLSDKQAGFLRSLLGRIDTRADRQAQRDAEVQASADCPNGRVTVTGVVLSVKVQESQFGAVTKMLVRDDTGYKVWGTRPTLPQINGEWQSCIDKGDKVQFTATVKRSDNDPKFGFYSRPTKARVIQRAGNKATSQ